MREMRIYVNSSKDNIELLLVQGNYINIERFMSQLITNENPEILSYIVYDPVVLMMMEYLSIVHDFPLSVYLEDKKVEKIKEAYAFLSEYMLSLEGRLWEAREKK